MTLHPLDLADTHPEADQAPPDTEGETPPAPSPDEPTVWLTLDEAAERAGVSRRTITRRIDAGKIAGAYRDGDDNSAPWRIPAQAIKPAAPQATQRTPSPDAMADALEAEREERRRAQRTATQAGMAATTALERLRASEADNVRLTAERDKARRDAEHFRTEGENRLRDIDRQRDANAAELARLDAQRLAELADAEAQRRAELAATEERLRAEIETAQRRWWQRRAR